MVKGLLTTQPILISHHILTKSHVMSVLSAVLLLLCTVGNVVKLVRSRKKKGTRRESMRVTLNESSKCDRKGGKRGLTVDGRS